MKQSLRTTFAERMSYGGYFLGQNLVFAFVMQFLTVFYTDQVGIAPLAVGTLFLVARVWDAVNDVLLGVVVDRSNFRGGKFKPWINATIFIMPIVSIAVFVNPEIGGTGNLVYAYITYILWGMVYTVSDVPIFAISAVMTDNVDERVRIISIGRLAAGIAFIISGVVAAPIIASLGWSATTIVMMGVAFAVMIPVRFLVKERVVYQRTERVTFKSMIEAVTRNTYLMIFYLAFIIINGLNTSGVVGVFFATYNLGNFELFSLINFTSIAPILILPIFVPALVKSLGKKRLFLILAGISVVAGLIQYFVGYQSFPAFLVLNALRTIGVMSPGILMGLFSADCAEYGAYVTGKRNEGITFSIQTFSTKLGLAFGGFIGTALLGVFGYVANVEQTQGALDGIWIMMTLVPTAGLAVAMVIIGLFYRLKESDVQRMINEMKVAGETGTTTH